MISKTQSESPPNSPEEEIFNADHEIDKIIELFDHGMIWYDYTGKSYPIIRYAYAMLRIGMLFFMFAMATEGIYQEGVRSIDDGTMLYLPLSLFLLVHQFLSYLNQSKTVRLLETLRNTLSYYEEEWQQNMFLAEVSKVWKVVNVYRRYKTCSFWLYAALPVAIDVVLHWCGLLEKPYYVPTVSFINVEITEWNLDFYARQLIALSFMYFQCYGFFSFMTGNATLCYYMYVDILVLRRSVKTMNDGSGIKPERIKEVVSHHERLLQLHDVARDTFGLFHAFLCIYTSLGLTIAMYTSYTNEDPFIKFSYGYGIVLHMIVSIVYNWLGQIVATESVEVSYEVYNLPWYFYNPKVRKDLMMMIRQGSHELILDYHGKYDMSLNNFSAIISAAYSYFTVLRSMSN